MRKILTIVLVGMLLSGGVTHAAVAKSDSGTPFINNTSAGTSLNLTTLTVSAGSNLCLIAMLSTAQTAISSPVVKWDNAGTPQTMTSAGSTANGAAIVNMFYLVAPTTGNKTLNATWTNAADAALAAIAFSGADQTTCINAANTIGTTGTSTAPSLTVTSTTDGATVVAVSTGTDYINATTTQTNIYRNTTGSVGGAASYGLGGASNTHTFGSASSVVYAARGVNVIAAAAAGATPRMTLLGVGP